MLHVLTRRVNNILVHPLSAVGCNKGLGNPGTVYEIPLHFCFRPRPPRCKHLAGNGFQMLNETFATQGSSGSRMLLYRLRLFVVSRREISAPVTHPIKHRHYPYQTVILSHQVCISTGPLSQPVAGTTARQPDYARRTGLLPASIARP